MIVEETQIAVEGWHCPPFSQAKYGRWLISPSRIAGDGWYPPWELRLKASIAWAMAPFTHISRWYYLRELRVMAPFTRISRWYRLREVWAKACIARMKAPFHTFLTDITSEKCGQSHASPERWPPFACISRWYHLREVRGRHVSPGQWYPLHTFLVDITLEKCGQY